MKIVVVGAGAVGQVFGRHLALGGAEVTFLVKPKYREEAEAGFRLYPLNGGARDVRFDDYRVLSSDEEVAAESWDQAWLAVSAPALGGDWLGPFLDAVGNATVVCLSPGVDTRDLLLTHVPPERLVLGLISLIAYQAPLEGETRFSAPGIAYWFPPVGASPFSGPPDAVASTVSTLRRGGQPARAAKDVSASQVFPNATMMPHLLALEAAGWTFSGLREGDHLALASRGAREAIAIAARHQGSRPPLTRLLARPWVMSAGMGLADRVIPIDLETYLRYHFTKVHDQTLLFVHRFIELGRRYDLSTDALEELCRRVAI